MADAGPMRIQRPMDLFSQNPTSPVHAAKTKRRSAEEDTTQNTRGAKRKRDDEQGTFTSEEPPLKRAKTSDELLPSVKRTEKVLPEKGSDVNFNTSFLHAKKPEEDARKGGLALSAHRRDQILLNFEERLNAKDPEMTDFERKLLASDLGHLMKVATQVIDMRMDEQKETLESFKLLSEKMRHLRGEKSKVLDDMIKNAKLQDYWSSARDMISYLTTGLGIFTGVGTFAFGVAIGNPFFVKSGILSILGSIGNITTKLMADQNYDEKYTNAVALISTLLVGYNCLNSLPIPENMGKLEMLGLLGKMGGTASQSVTQYQTSQAKAESYTIQAEGAKIQHHLEKNKSTLKNALEKLKLLELLNEVKAASAQIAEEDKLKERIAQILYSAN